MPVIDSDSLLEWICSNQNTEELLEKYEQWANTYETDVASFWEQVPLAAAHMLLKYVRDKHDIILDVGAGTGLVGAELAKLGFKHIIGIDISPSMLNIASTKGVYRSLIPCSIKDEKFSRLSKINNIVAVGVFAEGHAGATELTILQERINQEGILVFTARQSFFHKLYDIVTQPELKLLDYRLMPIYSDPICLFAYKKI